MKVNIMFDDVHLFNIYIYRVPGFGMNFPHGNCMICRKQRKIVRAGFENVRVRAHTSVVA